MKAVPVPSTVSSQIGQILVRCRPRNTSILFSLLLSGNKLVQLVHPKNVVFPLQDLLILVTFVNQLDALRTGDTFTPLCLPSFNPEVKCFAVQYSTILIASTGVSLCVSFFTIRRYMLRSLDDGFF
jgi:hypothetical protein